MARLAAPTIEWLVERHGLPFSVVTDFDHPGHSRSRMHGLPSRAARHLIDALRGAAEATGGSMSAAPATTRARISRNSWPSKRIWR